MKLEEKVVQSADGNDATVEKKSVAGIKLYRCTDEDGTFHTVEVKDGPLKQSDLDSMVKYILCWLIIILKSSRESLKIKIYFVIRIVIL